MPKWPVGRLEQVEKLEQLRVLENGVSIFVAVTDHAALGIDTPADYAAFVARQRAA
jgi:3-deoxy-manno-octulosonate cytidylyltransferase (CMP-KDO synthetase)